MATTVQHVPSRDVLLRAKGLSPEFGFMEFNTMDLFHVGDDFEGPTIDIRWGTAVSGGTALAIQAGQPWGQGRLVSGGTDDNYSGASMGLHFQGQYNCVLAARVKSSAVAGIKIELGFTDVVAGTDAGAVATLATPSFNADDFVGWVLDTDDTGDWQAVGVDSTSAATKIEPGITPEADTFETLIVALADTSAYFYRLDVNGKQTYSSRVSSGPMAGACSDTVGLTPWIFAQTRANAGSRNVNFDFVRAWSRRQT